MHSTRQVRPPPGDSCIVVRRYASHQRHAAHGTEAASALRRADVEALAVLVARLIAAAACPAVAVRQGARCDQGRTCGQLCQMPRTLVIAYPAAGSLPLCSGSGPHAHTQNAPAVSCSRAQDERHAHARRLLTPACARRPAGAAGPVRPVPRGLPAAGGRVAAAARRRRGVLAQGTCPCRCMAWCLPVKRCAASAAALEWMQPGSVHIRNIWCCRQCVLACCRASPRTGLWQTSAAEMRRLAPGDLPFLPLVDHATLVHARHGYAARSLSSAMASHRLACWFGESGFNT